MITPFESTGEAESWVKRNCETCRLKASCYSYFDLDNYFKHGKISIESAEYIGYSTKYGLFIFCQHREQITKLNFNQQTIF